MSGDTATELPGRTLVDLLRDPEAVAFAILSPDNRTCSVHVLRTSCGASGSFLNVPTREWHEGVEKPKNREEGEARS